MAGMMIRSERMRLRGLLGAAGIVAVLAGNPLHAQDDDTGQPAAETAVDESADDSGDSADEIEELEDESYLDAEEEDFTPSEELPTDQSIPFPTDI